MAKPKESKEQELFLGEIRRLKSENKSLRKRLRQLEKNAHIVKELKLNQEADEEAERDKFLVNETPQLEICPNCARRGISDLIIYDRLFKVCCHCKHRSKAIKISIKND